MGYREPFVVNYFSLLKLFKISYKFKKVEDVNSSGHVFGACFPVALEYLGVSAPVDSPEYGGQLLL